MKKTIFGLMALMGFAFFGASQSQANWWRDPISFVWRCEATGPTGRLYQGFSANLRSARAEAELACSRQEGGLCGRASCWKSQ